MKDAIAIIQTEIVSSDGATVRGEQKVLHEHGVSVYVNGMFFRKLTCTEVLT